MSGVQQGEQLIYLEGAVRRVREKPRGLKENMVTENSSKGQDNYSNVLILYKNYTTGLALQQQTVTVSHKYK